MHRRQILRGAAGLGLISGWTTTASGATASGVPLTAQALPLSSVRLLPSVYADALQANQAYLLRLSADRFLHNYHRFAGLPTKGAIYGGWESDTIAGEGLGHYLSALSLMHAQTGNPALKPRIDYIVAELARVQQAHGDGYAAGFMRKRQDGVVVDGKEIFPEIMRGEIRSAGFDLNGCWVPLYNWHKVFAGLFDAQTHAGNEQALQVALGLAGYIDKVFAALSDEQVQQVLACEHGGINESFAELYARTSDKRWLALAQRLYHVKVLLPLTQGRDELANLHSNTQIPKLIGLARLHELTGRRSDADAVDFFWKRVTQHHSYVIGGNGDREYFSAPDSIAAHITEQTCEACASYNMLKMTRHLYSWAPDAAYFDYYERTHLNHILAHQNPRTGMFTYMTPLMSGVAREYSSEDNDFWCCVLSGMESHAKHGDSVYWENGDTLFVNLYIPSTVEWKAAAARLELNTRYPYEGDIELKVRRLAGPREFTLALRIPSWADACKVLVNGKPQTASKHKGYLLLRRRWRAGDSVRLSLPLDLRLESTPGNERVVALLRGPMVLAADLGAADKPFSGLAPALVGANILASFAQADQGKSVYRSVGSGRPGDMKFAPFFSQYERRAAVYFHVYTDAEWAASEVGFRKEEARLKDLAARSVDVMHLGEMQPERDHDLQSDISYPVSYRGRNGRDARTGGYFSFRMKCADGPLLLQASYWGEERNRDFHISIDGERIARVKLDGGNPGVFIDQEYPVPERLTSGKGSVVVRFDPEPGHTAGPVFGVRLYTPP
ncbi:MULTISPECIES: glycoside hydrolase family 127 protein [unclassified Duganella]|uniref:glycoside hydrolase family 127 protein n=1 Tax=unclassified Duganella TaxID=2636909 RepID=UPI000E345749|nr:MULTISPECIES: glycoside hydrolase family 127 protein [unclassified Duganella]RFP10074.1 glycoside hydrolase family 127 protein [Duganella sp. BJB475]RFP25620.1 glycoside hydrolase family 127 protein [Duganella sp. BJB476]